MGDDPDLAALFGSTPSSVFLDLSACNDLASRLAAIALIAASGASPCKVVGA